MAAILSVQVVRMFVCFYMSSSNLIESLPWALHLIFLLALWKFLWDYANTGSLETRVFLLSWVWLSGGPVTFMTAVWSQCTLGALVLMDDCFAGQCHCLQDHFPSTLQTRAVWIGDLWGKQMNGDLVTMPEWASVYDGEGCWLHQSFRGSRCGIGLLWRQTLLFWRESKKLLMYLIDMLFYGPLSFKGWYAFYKV